MIPKRCQHGVSMDKSAMCRECELVWYRECLADAERRVISCLKQIARLSTPADHGDKA